MRAGGVRRLARHQRFDERGLDVFNAVERDAVAP
jgi:hypothetical protein